MEDWELELRRLELDEKKAEREYQGRLKELELKQDEIRLKHDEIKRSRWTNPLVLSVIAAAIAATGNAYVSWLNGENESRVETTKSSGQRAIEREKFEAERILEATKSSNPKEAATKIKFLIEVGLISDTNRQAALDAYLKSEEQSGTSSPKKDTIVVPYKSGWLGGGNNQADQCTIGRTIVAQTNPGKTILLRSSSEENRRDFFGRVEYRYSCIFEVN